MAKQKKNENGTADIKRLKNMSKWSRKDYDHYMDMFDALEKITKGVSGNYKELPEKVKTLRFEAFKKGVQTEIEKLN